MHFEWDGAKAEANRRKHKVSFDEAVSVFYDPLSATLDWLPPMSGNDMKPKRTNHVAQMRAEYELDYSKAVRGKYYKRLLAEGSNVVVLDRDVAKAFPDSAAVNTALRSVLQARRRRRAAGATRTRAKAARAG